jgi:hypothetical protein
MASVSSQSDVSCGNDGSPENFEVSVAERVELPIELWTLIFEDVLQAPKGHPFLLRAARTCRWLHDLALPVLLSNIDVDAGHAALYNPNRRSRRSIRAGSMLDSFLRDNLGCDKFQYIRRLFLPNDLSSVAPGTLHDPHVRLLASAIPNLYSVSFALNALRSSAKMWRCLDRAENLTRLEVDLGILGQQLIDGLGSSGRPWLRKYGTMF